MGANRATRERLTVDDPAFSGVRNRVSACRVVVTGAAGFIGSAVCHALLDAGGHVARIDSFDPFHARRVKEGRLVMLRRRARFTFREADVRTTGLMEEVLARADSLGVAPVAFMAPAQGGDAARTLADLNKARAALGYCPTVAVETGVPEFIEWFEVAYGRQSRAAS